MRMRKGAQEIHALHYAACWLMFLLDETLFRGGLVTEGFSATAWKRVDKGLNLTVVGEISDPHYQSLQINPVGWPADSYVRCRFSKWGQGWLPEDGVLHTTFIPLHVAFRVKTLLGGLPVIIPVDNTAEALLLKRLLQGYHKLVSTNTSTILIILR